MMTFTVRNDKLRGIHRRAFNGSSLSSGCVYSEGTRIRWLSDKTDFSLSIKLNELQASLLRLSSKSPSLLNGAQQRIFPQREKNETLLGLDEAI